MAALVPRDEEVFDRRIAALLRFGVLLSASVIAAGAAVYLWKRSGTLPDYHVFRGEPAELRSVASIVLEATSLSGRALIQLGVLLLIATPVMRVLVSVIGFALQRDWMYSLITSIVLGLLLFSLFAGTL